MAESASRPTVEGLAPLVSGPYLAVGAVIALALLERMVPTLPNPAVLLLMVVVYASFSGGVIGGFVAGAITLAFAIGTFASAPTQPGALGQLMLLILVTPSTVLMLGWLQARAARAAKLQVLNQRLLELDELKTQFLNNAAHELRTPLTPIKTQMHILKNAEWGGLNDRQQRAISMMDRNIERLNLLVQDLLEVARLQAGRLKLDRRPMDLSLLAHEAVESFGDPARQAGIRLDLRTGPPLMVDADPKRLIQVMFNLLSNALKFTPTGGQISVELTCDETDAIVRVRDTGRGMKAEDIGKLFNPFSQIADGSEVTQPGSGLGLFICRGILEQHGGRVWAESPGPGQGSVFTFALPLAEHRAEASDAAETAPKRPATRAPA